MGKFLVGILILVFSSAWVGTVYAQEDCTDDVTYCDTNIGKYVHKHGGYWDGSQCIYAFDVEANCGGGGSPPAPPATCSNGTKYVGDTWPECHGCAEGTVTCIGQDRYSSFNVVRDPSPNCGLGCERRVPTPPPTATYCPEQHDPPYGQCGNTYGLEGRDPNLTFEITRVRDCYGNVIRYDNDGGQYGRECDKRGASPTPAPVNSVTGINIDDINVSFDNLSRGWKITLQGQKEKDQVFTIPIKIQYSDQTTRYLYFIFNYHSSKFTPTPAFTPTPTSSPTPIYTPTSAPTFIPTPTPTSIPTQEPTPSSKEVTRVTINGEDVDIDQLKSSGFRMTVAQNTLSGGTANLPILVSFNDGSIKSTVFKLHLNSPQEPPAPVGLPFAGTTPSPVAEPTEIPTIPPTPVPTKIPLSGRVIIDPGHGVPDLDEGKTEEARANLAVARRLKQMLEADGISASLTHDSSLNISSHYQDLQKRVDIINQSEAQLFVAIHFDSGNYPFNRGPRAYYNSSRLFSSANRRLAELVSSAISRTTSSSLNGNIGRAEILEDIRAGACCGPLYLLGSQGVRTIESKSESAIRRASAIPGILAEYFTVGVSYNNTVNNAPLIEQIAQGYKDGIEQYLKETNN